MSPAGIMAAPARDAPIAAAVRFAPTVPVVLGGHFLSAFAVLGMPLFLQRFWPSLGARTPSWALGALFALPTIAAALAAPLWGRVADRWGRRLSLRRAHLGLCGGFLLAGISPGLGWFALALLLQGACGGAMAASNAYLAGQLDRDGLRRALNWTQFSARLAMVSAPGLIGVLLDRGIGRQLYLAMALLPLAALLGTLWLPADPPAARPLPARRSRAGLAAATEMPPDRPAMRAVMAVQALFSAAAVLTFPYFVPFAARLGIRDAAAAGLLYALPHLVYLLGLPILRGRDLAGGVPRGLLLLAAAAALQAALGRFGVPDPSGVSVARPSALLVVTLVGARLSMGVGLVLVYAGLHAAVSRLLPPGRAGLVFSRFDAAAKWAGAVAGLFAGFGQTFVGPSGPFLLSITACALALPAAQRLAKPIGSPA